MNSFTTTRTLVLLVLVTAALIAPSLATSITPPLLPSVSTPLCFSPDFPSSYVYNATTFTGSVSDAGNNTHLVTYNGTFSNGNAFESGALSAAVVYQPANVYGPMVIVSTTFTMVYRVPTNNMRTWTWLGGLPALAATVGSRVNNGIEVYDTRLLGVNPC
eukprot:TRINITY_DN2569_c0_g1_i1.p1 TRINITY_DN2569_c0_g1~~TRINITY_DN2569_c0_g1_i1.p1  ORF type:complete len:160 (-),score=36.33 TRINITY_DN2569_c0_g1_i1:209-688(-)